jgi:hypothetical protein
MLLLVHDRFLSGRSEFFIASCPLFRKPILCFIIASMKRCATAMVLASGAFLISIVTSAGKALFSGTTFPLTFISKAHGMLLFLQLSQEGTGDRMMSPHRCTWAINL